MTETLENVLAAAEAEEAAREAEKTAWLPASSEMTLAADELVKDREDVVVKAGPGATALNNGFKGPKAYFDTGGKAMAEIRIDTAQVPDSDPGKWLDDPVLRGLLTHEAAHASHTLWKVPEDTDYFLGNTAKMLEESRVEKRHLSHRRQDRKWLRASAETLLEEANTAIRRGNFDAENAIRAAALILPRADAGVLTKRQVRDIRDRVRRTLGGNVLQDLEDVWKRALKVEDTDAEGMLGVAREWQRVLADAGLEDESLRVAYAAVDFANDAPKTASATRKPIEGPVTKGDVYTIQGDSVKMTEEEKEQLKQRNEHISHDVFNDHIEMSFRSPDDDERKLARKTRKELEEAYLFDRTKTRVMREVPPGRLSGRVLQQTDALHSAGYVVAPEPFSRKEIKRDFVPPLRVGILQDVSGSQDWAAGQAAVGAWALATAVRGIPESEVAMVSFGETVLKVFGPFEDIRGVPVFECNDDGEVLSQALAALEGKLDLLSRKPAARLLVIITDGWFVTPGELAKRDRLLRRYVDAGVRVLWIASGGGGDNVIPDRVSGATVVYGNGDIAEIICREAVRLVSRVEE